MESSYNHNQRADEPNNASKEVVMGLDGSEDSDKSAQGTKDDKGRAPKTGFFKRLKDLPPIDRFTFFVAVFTALLAVIGIGQLLAFIQSERAHLAITKVKIESFPATQNDPFEVILTIKNGGKSAAAIQQYHPVLIIAAAINPLPDRPRYFEGIKKGRIAIAPNDTYEQVVSIRPANQAGEAIPWTAEIAHSVSTGASRFYIYGFIDYSDDFTIFRNARTGFCTVYGKDTPKTAVLSGCGLDGYSY